MFKVEVLSVAYQCHGAEATAHGWEWSVGTSVYIVERPLASAFG